MPAKSTSTAAAAKLRKLAEARVGRRSGKKQADPADTQRLLHELQVHQVELEMQNTELQEARDGMESLLEKYTDLYDFAPAGYFTLNSSGIIQMVNLTGATLVGMDRSRLVGQSFTNLIPADSRPAFRTFLQNVFAGPAKQEGDFRLCCKGHLPRVVKISTQRSVSGVECNAVLVDITERQEAEEALRLTNTAIQSVASPIFITTSDGTIQYVNPAFTLMSGYSAIEAIGQKPSIVRSGEHDEAFYQKLWETIGTGRGWSGQITNRQKNGKLYVCEQSISPVKNAAGEITHFVSVQRDITERLQAELMAHRSQALFTALFAQAPVGVYVVDSKFRLRQVNPKAKPVFASMQPHIGRDFAEVVHILWPKKIAAEVIKRFRHTLKTGEPHHVIELAGKRRDLRVKKIYEWSLQRIILPGGEHNVVCFFEDITERKQAELAQRRLAVLTALNHKMKREIVRREVLATALEASRQSTYELLITSRQQRQELRDLSHRLLTAHEDERKRISRELHDVIAQALTGVSLELASLNGEGSAISSDIAEKIARTQQLVMESADAVHRFARDLRPSVLDDIGIVPALRTFAEDFMKRTGLAVQLTAHAGVEKLGSVGRTVLYRIAQEALMNVSRHAKATRVDILLQKRPGRICLEIQDNGQGFDASETTTCNRLGILGMRERVEMIGGTFCIESSPGHSTSIRVEIPSS